MPHTMDDGALGASLEHRSFGLWPQHKYGWLTLSLSFLRLSEYHMVLNR